MDRYFPVAIVAIVAIAIVAVIAILAIVAVITVIKPPSCHVKIFFVFWGGVICV